MKAGRGVLVNVYNVTKLRGLQKIFLANTENKVIT